MSLSFFFFFNYHHHYHHSMHSVKLEMPKRVRKLEKDGKMLNVNEGR